MEENINNVVTSSANSVVATEENKKSSKNLIMLVILLGLFIIFTLFIYIITKNKEAELMMLETSNSVIIPSKPVNVSPRQVVEPLESIEVGSADEDLQDLNTDLQGL